MRTPTNFVGPEFFLFLSSQIVFHTSHAPGPGAGGALAFTSSARRRLRVLYGLLAGRAGVANRALALALVFFRAVALGAAAAFSSCSFSSALLLFSPVAFSSLFSGRGMFFSASAWWTPFAASDTSSAFSALFCDRGASLLACTPGKSSFAILGAIISCRAVSPEGAASG